VKLAWNFPFLAIFNTGAVPVSTAIGIADTDYSIKYNFHPERPGSKWPAITASLNIEPPTGNSHLQLGWGLIDYYLNGIIQKTVSPKTVLRLNAGATLAGNTLTGVVGINTRGRIFTGGASLTHPFTKKFDLGTEVYGGYTANLALGRGELEQQIGGNYEIGKALTLDFGVIAGQAVGSPRYGFQLGFSKDF
jgi:hypothetical protein